LLTILAILFSLLVCTKKAKSPPDAHHLLGYAKYFISIFFKVAIMLFGIEGLF